MTLLIKSTHKLVRIYLEYEYIEEIIEYEFEAKRSIKREREIIF